MLDDRSLLSYGRQWIDDEDIAAVVEVLKSPALTQGPAVSSFEKALCQETGAKYSVAVANGTAALHLAVAALSVEEGSSGVTSPITFMASSNALIHNRIAPIFADVVEATAAISAETIRAVLRPDTRVIIPVHFAGKAADMQEISRLAREKKCSVIEDAAHALGSSYADGSRVGGCRYSDMTVFSFHPVKTITTGEGGAVMTNDPKLHERLTCLRSHGIVRDPALMSADPGPWYHEMQHLGFNFRLTDIQAVLGMSQLRKLSRFAARRREIVRQYNAAFSGLEHLRPLLPDDDRTVYHLYVVLMDFTRLGMSRAEVMAALKDKGIGTQVHYIPVHTQPYYQKTCGTRSGDLPVAEKYYEKCLSLPLFPAMTDEDIERVISAVVGLGK
jgi:UDP-4-amino-4,6-dideoxy-N-acetyl-beta-L-altrosamine transaminase